MHRRYQQEGALRDADAGGRAGHAIRVVRSEQTCALGAAMFAAVAAGVYKDINEATRHMGSDIELNTGRMRKEPSSTKNYTRNILNWQNLLKPLTKYTNH